MTVHLLNDKPNREICVSTLGAEYFGRNVARLLNADFDAMPSLQPHAYKMIYLIGFYVPLAEQSLRVFANSPKACRKVIHWLGTDILQMKQLSAHDLRELRDIVNSTVHFQFCESEAKQRELDLIGIKAEILPLLRDISQFKATPLPQEFAVAVYQPSVNRKNYCPALMMNIVENLPEVKFYFFGNKNKLDGTQLENLEVLGWTDIEKVINKSSLLLRYTLHDGLPTAPMEFTLSGRYVVTNVEMPFVELLSGQGNAATVRDEIIEKIRSLKYRVIRGEIPDSIAAEYYRSSLAPDQIVKRLRRIIGTIVGEQGLNP